MFFIGCQKEKTMSRAILEDRVTHEVILAMIYCHNVHLIKKPKHFSTCIYFWLLNALLMSEDWDLEGKCENVRRRKEMGKCKFQIFIAITIIRVSLRFLEGQDRGKNSLIILQFEPHIRGYKRCVWKWSSNNHTYRLASDLSESLTVKSGQHVKLVIVCQK